MASPVFRYLRGYSLDPGFSTRLDTARINEVTYQIPFEDKLEPGPVGEYFEVADFDPASNCWYDPVDLNDVDIASQYGLSPSEGNPQFHQQFVYTVAMKTVGHFERALGRKIIWYPQWGTPTKPDGYIYVGRLRLYPHAMRDANAYYDPKKKAILFGYFAAADQMQGTNYPGGLIFTCLSPDIVAHETTHAILDSIQHRYIEDTNIDVAAFHEGFADIVALLQRFTFSNLVEHQLYNSGGRLDRNTALGDLATQFGEALQGNRGALRSMIGKLDDNGQWESLKPKPADYSNIFEAHRRGAILVATIFDAFQRVYSHRTADLLRIASNGTGQLPEGNISRDLVHRLASEASDIAGHLLAICIRALDYCPPLDITFGDYLRALITADVDIAPDDEAGYRVALIEAFRARGIFPDRVNTLSVESLRWARPSFSPQEQLILDRLAKLMKPSIRYLLETVERKEIYDRMRNAQNKVRDLFSAKETQFDPGNWEPFLNLFGLTSLPVSEIFSGSPSTIEFCDADGKPASYVPEIEVHAVRPALRAGREGRQIEQVLVTLTQTIHANIGLQKPMTFRGGATLIFSLGALSTVDLVVQKNIRSLRRFERQKRYLRGEDDSAPPAVSTYADDTRSWRLDFSLLHQHVE